MPGQAWCQPCRTAYARNRRAIKRAEALAYQRSYSETRREDIAAAQRARRATPEGAAKHRASVRRAEQQNPAAQRARRAIAHELRAGRLARPDACERCHRPCKPHAHHHDYARPLEVEWLCSICHGKEHRDATD